MLASAFNYAVQVLVERGWPNPVGLLMGLLGVLIAQVVLFFAYAIVRSRDTWTRVQEKQTPATTLFEDVWEHVTAPGSFLLVFGYLCFVWMLDLLPQSYYDLESPVVWWHVLAQFVVVDFLTYINHRISHIIPALYKLVHKPHHKFIVPKQFNAFNGSVLDTISLILLPLFGTAQICRMVSCWDFIAFGSMYASQFTLIHSEYLHPWDDFYEALGIGTAGFHNVHHAVFVWSYGHFFEHWDRLFGTFKSPHEVKGFTTNTQRLGVVPSSTVYFFTALFCFLIYAEYFKLLFVVSVVLYLYAPFLKRKTAVPLKLPAPVKVFDKVVPEATEPRKWKLSTERGRQVWSFNEKQTPDQQKIYDKYFLGLDTSKEAPVLPTPKNAKEATENALKFFCGLQMEDGHWGNDYGGPLFLMPGLIITCYISKTPFTKQQTIEMIRYLSVQQREDGGWGLHIESPSTMFGTATNYIAMRLLGVPAEDPRMIKGRQWLQSRGGALSVPAWGKFWLSALGLYEWDGMNPVPPELWVLPYWLPIHPGRWWCHCRVVYLPMAWVYGARAREEKPSDLILSLRKEIYVHEYDTIDWIAQCNNVYRDDDYKGNNWIQKTAFGLCAIYEYWRPKFLRDYALSVALDHIRYEDRETHYICIGPVNKALDMLCEYWGSLSESKDPKFKNKAKVFDALEQHRDRVKDYLWLAADGMKMQGYNGSQLWDTAFALQALMETGLCDTMKEARQAAVKGYDYIDITQVRENNTDRENYYRHISKGAWPFSTVDHGWPISDCTAEGFLCAIQMPKKINACKDIGLSSDRLFDAVNVMLSYQNPDGGWPSYENQRGPAWLENLNPSGCFDGIMVDYSYVECSSSCIKALLKFKEQYPTHRNKEIDAAVERGVKYLQTVQKPDGSWHGCWAVCYTYAGWFATNALYMAKKAGLGKDIDVTLNKAWKFFESKQHADGSWGEDFRSCCERKWVDIPEGHVVNTAWAVISLMLNDSNPNTKAIEKAIQWLIKKQLPNGDWAQEGISGVFNYNCAISYSGYKNYFPIWALGLYLTKFQK